MDEFDIDRAKAELSLEELAARCEVELTTHGSGPNVRIDCPFICPGDHAGKREISRWKIVAFNADIIAVAVQFDTGVADIIQRSGGAARGRGPHPGTGLSIPA